MKIFSGFRPEVAKIIKAGGVGVLPTDTLYGIVGSARNQAAIERIYKIKKRNPKKPLIILISSLMHLKEFGVDAKEAENRDLEKYWPGPVSLIFDSAAPEYLTRGQKSLAFRFPNDPEILKIIEAAGPLVAPSANPEGENPAQTIEEAVKYFKDEVDFYVNSGEINREPSKIIKITEGGVEEIRP